jgi:hypothetical protein
LGIDYRNIDETIEASVKTLIRWGKLPAMDSQITLPAVAVIATELLAFKPNGQIGGGELIQWLITRHGWKYCPTRAVRAAELLQVQRIACNLKV